MIAVLTVIFTVRAWKKGWRWRALLPMLVGYGAAFFIGIVISADGGAFEGALPVFVLLDLVILGSVIAMASRAPKAVLSSSSVSKIFPTATAGPVEG
jgi:hypothetical protein